MVRQAHHERDINLFSSVRPELVEGYEHQKKGVLCVY
jgi:hypothetical protein